MTSKTVTSIELKDIKAIEFECPKCHTKQSFTIERFVHPMCVCNVCQPPKAFMVQQGKEYEDFVMLGKLIRDLSQTKTGLIVRLEIS